MEASTNQFLKWLLIIGAVALVAAALIRYQSGRSAPLPAEYYDGPMMSKSEFMKRIQGGNKIGTER